MKPLNIIVIILLVLVSSSCVSRKKCARFFPAQVVKTDSVTTVVRETVHDTILSVTADSSWLKAWIECDSLGQATIKELIGYQSGIKAQIPKITLKNNVLSADCFCDSSKIHAILKSRETTTKKKSDTTITPPAIEVKFIPGWMWFFGITGMISWGVIILYVVFKVVKSKFL